MEKCGCDIATKHNLVGSDMCSYIFSLLTRKHFNRHKCVGWSPVTARSCNCYNLLIVSEGTNYPRDKLDTQYCS
jgi:hypothetical protein